jgi:hypothetical protein
VKTLALALILVAGCGRGGSPGAAVQALAEASREGDTARAWELLGPRTRARLEADAHLAAQQAGRRALPPSELLAAGWTPPRFELERVRELSRDDASALVEVRGPRGEVERVELVREAGQWKVELP